MRDLFIKLLQDQPSQNFGNKNTKINIHIPIRGRMLDYCIEINQEIQAITSSGIDFGPKSFQIPHITLYMGFVRNQKDFYSIMETIYSITKELKPFEISPTSPYLKAPKNNYAFIDTDRSSQIIDLKRIFKSRLDHFLEPLTWDVVGEIPHITIGYIKSKSNEVDELLSYYELGPNFYADAVEISFGGPWGSCIGTIRTFEFGK